jgi:hypothetical protein
MLRKHRLTPSLPTPEPRPDEIDIAATATVYMSSEDEAYPVEYAFDQRRGPGGSRWSAADPGEQTLLLVFDKPQPIRRILLGVEENEVSRTQELHLAVSRGGGQTFQEVVRQEYTLVRRAQRLSTRSGLWNWMESIICGYGSSRIKVAGRGKLRSLA